MFYNLLSSKYNYDLVLKRSRMSMLFSRCNRQWLLHTT